MAILLHTTQSANSLGCYPRLLLVGLICLSAACQRSPSARRRAAQQDRSAPQVAKIDWSLTRTQDNKALRIEYSVTNVTDKRIFLSDVMHTGSGTQRTLANPQPIVVMNDTEPGVVCFARGRIPTREHFYIPPFDPASRAIAPGQTISGSAQVPLPLAAGHYVGTVDPLEGKPTEAVLQLGYFTVEPQWLKISLPDGSSLSISHWSNRMEWIRSDIKPIPYAPFWKIF